MKKTLKKIAISLIISFSVVFVFEPYSFAGHFNSRRCCGTTETFGNGGEWIVKNNEKSKMVGYGVLGLLGVVFFIWLFKNGPSFKQQGPQKIYIQPKSESRNNEENQEYGKKFNYNPSHEGINPSEASDGVVIMEESNENFNNNSKSNTEQNDPSLITGDRF